MSRDDWLKTKKLLEEALDRPSHERHAFVESQPSEPAVRQEALRLLRELESDSGFLESPPALMAGSVLEELMSVPRLREGAILAQRFRISRFVGRGGMGEVYLADDLRSGARLALKVIGRLASPEPHAIAWLRDELNLARAVTHRNVCRVFDLHAHTASDDVTEMLFLTMEFLDGETLAERLARGGHMNFHQAEDLACQLAAGLSAAHQAGVVHGDLKPANVMLVPQGSGVRAVIMDFGIALADLRQPPPGRAPMGTPAYMAPEQADGAAAPASDIYSFGLVVYQALHGSRPPSPESSTPRLETGGVPHWFSAILRKCLHPDPAERYRHGTELLDALRARPRDRGSLWALTALALVAVGAAAWLAKPGPSNSSAPRPVLAVLGFRNAGAPSQSQYLSLLLSLALDAEFATAGNVRVVPAADVARSKLELNLPDADHLEAAVLQKIHSGIGADFVVLGSYAATTPGRIRVFIDAQDTRSGQTRGSITDEGSESDLPGLFSHAGALLRRRLQLGPPAPVEEVRAALPGSLDAMRLYAEGLQRLRGYDPLPARDYLEKAVAADPGYPQAHSALAQAWAALGFEQKARDESQRAYQLRLRLPRDQQLLIEASYYHAAGDDQKAQESYRQLLELSPDNPDYLLLLAGVERSAQALHTIAQLRRLPPPARDDPRIDLAEAEAADSANAYGQEREAARRAADKALKFGALLLAGDARIDEGWASWVMGSMDEAGAAYGEARQIFERVGNPFGVGRALRGLGLVAQYHGDLEGARKIYEQAYATLRAVGSLRQAAIAMNGLAMIASAEGKLADAIRHYTESLHLCESMRSPICIGTAQNNIGYVQFLEGKPAEGRHHIDLAMAAFAEGKGLYGKTFALSSLGDLLEAQGQLDESERDLHQSLDLSRRLKDRTSEASTSVSLAAVLLDRGAADEAARTCQRAIELQQAMGEADAAAKSRLMLARIELARHRPFQAESALRAALPELTRSNRRDEIAIAGALLDEALAMAHSKREAPPEAALKMLGASDNHLARVTILVASGRAALLRGNLGRARNLLSQAATEAAQDGYAGKEREARRDFQEAEKLTAANPSQ